MTLLSLFSRHIPATCSLLKVGRIIDYGFLTTWLRSTDYYPSNGWQRFGGRIPFSKMQKALPFKRWLFLITTFGFGKTKPSSTWSSKHSFNVSISMNHNGWLVQGVSFKNLILQMAHALFQCVFDPTIVKPKCVWGLAVLFSQMVYFVYMR